MNAIEMRLRIDQKIDRTATARHSDKAYYNAIMNSIWMVVKDRVAPIRVPRKYSVQSAQRIRDELYSLISAPVTGAPSAGIVPYPADYFTYLLLYATVSSTKDYCRPTDYNTIGPLKKNPFTKPTATKFYFNELSTGLKVEFGTTGTFSAYELYYVKNPAVVSIGQERDKILAGVTLTIAVVYYVYEEAVHNGVTYSEGETFTAATTTLTSGIVINTNKVVNCDLPVNMHEEICTGAAALLSSTVEDWNKKQSLDVDTEKS